MNKGGGKAPKEVSGRGSRTPAKKNAPYSLTGQKEERRVLGKKRVSVHFFEMASCFCEVGGEMIS